jgi:capsular polysaccharide biosynthesis protein
VGIVVPLVQASATDTYEADALVAPVRLTATNVDTVPRYGDVVFANGEVEATVRDVLGLGDGAAVIPRYVELVSAQDNPSFTIIGRADDPGEATELADLAAATFTREMNSTTVESVGTFSIQSTADVPTRPVPTLGGGRLAVVVGVLAGLVAAIGAVGLMLMLRRPVLDPATASTITGAPVLGRVRMRRTTGTRDDRDVMGIAPLARRILATRAPVVMLVSPGPAGAQRHELASALIAVLGEARPVRLVSGGDLDVRTAGRGPSQETAEQAPGRTGRTRSGRLGELVIVDGPTMQERAARPDTTLMALVVPEGISETALRQAAEEYLDGEGPGMVLVSRIRRVRGYRRRKVAASGGAEPAPEPDPEGPFFAAADDHMLPAEAQAGDDAPRPGASSHQ